MKNKVKKETKIKPDNTIADITKKHPDIGDYLAEEYGFYCAHCVMANFETLEEGAEVHGITGDDFEEMVDDLNSKILR